MPLVTGHAVLAEHLSENRKIKNRFANASLKKDEELWRKSKPQSRSLDWRVDTCVTRGIMRKETFWARRHVQHTLWPVTATTGLTWISVTSNLNTQLGQCFVLQKRQFVKKKYIKKMQLTPECIQNSYEMFICPRSTINY